MPITRKRQRSSSYGPSSTSRYAPRKMRLYRAPRTRAPAVYQFKRQIQQSTSLNLSSGIFGAGFDVNIVPSLGACEFRINGTAIFGPSLPNVAEFTSLFDQYRIKKVGVRVIFSQNNSDVDTAATCLPLMHQMNDYNDLNNKSLSDYQEYPELKTYQLGQDKYIAWSFVPHVRGDVLTTSGVVSSSAHNIPCPWIDTSSTNIQMLGTRMYFNNMGRNTNQDVGSVTWLVDYYLEFKFVR